MSRVVLDANTAIDWFVVTPEGEAYSRHLEKLIVSTQIRFLVPLHFDVEIVGHLVKKHRRFPNVYGADWLSSSLDVLNVLPIDIVGQGINFRAMGDLAKAYGLTPYDVPYFHLARMMEVPIASRDRGIISACTAWHVKRWMPD